MIEPAALRKGNWMLHKGRHRIIEEIGRHGIDLYSDHDKQVYAAILFEELEPIAISPELLVNLGFEELAGAPYEVGKGLQFNGTSYRKSVVHEGETFVFESSFNIGWAFQGIRLPRQPLEFHELQNLFFYLMNEELSLPEFD